MRESELGETRVNWRERGRGGGNGKAVRRARARRIELGISHAALYCKRVLQCCGTVLYCAFAILGPR